MNYNKDELELIIQKSCFELIEEQPMLFKQENNINERTISVELATKTKNHIDGIEGR